ncbi:hypothetical protein ACN4EG_01325 [Alkalinema pantanalense CENA528]
MQSYCWLQRLGTESGIIVQVFETIATYGRSFNESSSGLKVGYGIQQN